MEELTIKQKAQRYDRAIAIAREINNEQRAQPSNVMTRVFPELAESEDDRIRKKLIRAFQSLNTIKLWCGIERTDIIAWLEKQGEQKPVEWHREDEQNLNSCLGYIPDEFLRSWLTDIIHVKYDNLADKVKFHKGDWIIHQGTDNIYQVVAVLSDHYQLKYGDNYTIQKCSDVDRCARLWDITKDAKDGDVLSYRNGQWIFILKRIIDKDSFEYYTLWSTTHNDLTINDSAFSLLINSIYPATKEQRDTLEKAMADAGYTFDFEKKELKKIK